MEERFKKWEEPKLEHGVPTKWNWVVLRPENFKCGKDVDIGAFSLICAHHGVVLEDDVQLGGGVKIYSYNTIDDTKGEVVIKKGACVGANSVVLPGFTIGEGAVVGALSLVKCDIPANEVWAGSPCRFIRKRC